MYLYLANNSSDESWRNVIKEYKLTGKDCVHYNLPAEQQSAIQHYLNVQSYPTYKLIDKQRNIHDLDWRKGENLNKFRELLEQFDK